MRFERESDHIGQALTREQEVSLLQSCESNVPPGIPFPPGSTDLQTWIRNSSLDPNWLRVGTDITGQGPFNASFSLTSVPEPCTLLLTGAGLLGLMLKSRSRRTACSLSADCR